MDILLGDLKDKFPHMDFNWLNHNNISIIKKTLCDFQWRFVGGIVRDSLLGVFSYDIDICISASPTEVLNKLKNLKIFPVETGIEHGTISIFLCDENNNHWTFEITSLRKDVITDGRHAKVVFGGTWEEDSQRRDFTMNSLMLDLYTMKIYDYCNGLDHLVHRKVCFINDINKRIQEDYLRILRYVRFFCRFGKDFPDDQTIKVLGSYAPKLKILSKERIWMEWSKILTTDKWITGVQILKEINFDKIILGFDLFVVNYTIDLYYWNLESADNILIRFLLCCIHCPSADFLKSWPFPRQYKNFIDLLYFIENDIFLSAAKIWQKHKDLIFINVFCLILYVKKGILIKPMIDNSSESKFLQLKNLLMKEMMSLNPRKRTDWILALKFFIIKNLSGDFNNFYKNQWPIIAGENKS